MMAGKSLKLGMLGAAAVACLLVGCATSPTIQGQAQGIGLAVQHASERTRGDTSNDASVFWALVVNNALVALGLPVIAGLFWYKRKQVKDGG